MIKFLKQEKQRLKMLNTYISAKQVYSENIYRLNILYEATKEMGKNGLDVNNKIKRALNQCESCIKRFDTMIQTLQKRDYRHIQDQIKHINSQTQDFSVLTQEIDHDIHHLITPFFII